MMIRRQAIQELQHRKQHKYHHHHHQQQQEHQHQIIRRNYSLRIESEKRIITDEANSTFQQADLELRKMAKHPSHEVSV